MKLIYKIFTGAILLSFMSCNLDEEPFSFFAPENFYKNKKDAEAAIMSVYDTYQDDIVGLLHLSSAPTSEVIIEGTGTDVLDMLDWDAGENVFYSYWRRCYIGINRANAAIDRIPGIDVLSEEVINTLVAEARFLRAGLYFDLVRLYGNVPYIDKETTDLDNIYPSNQNTASQVWQLIIDDLQFAETHLPETRPNNEWGRATRWAAKGILAKVYLQRSGLAKYNPFPERWGVAGVNEFEMAYQKAQEIIDSQQFELLNDYADVFEQEFNSERIFEIQFETGIGEGSGLPMNTVPEGSIEGRGFGITRLSPEFLTEWEEADARYDRTWLLSYTSLSNGNFISYPEVLEHPYSQKYRISDGQDSDNGMNVTLLRYADVLLMHSEAALEAGTGDAYMGLNMIRERAGYDPVSSLAENDLRDEIRKQRRFELIIEFNGFFDVQRWGTLEEEAQQAGYNYNSAYEIYPIPLREFDINPNLQQNPEY